jgi:membrane protein DedA with SNARE-associated domain
MLLWDRCVCFLKEAFSLLANLTSALTTLITNLYLATGLFGIVVAMAVESCCIPLPSEIVMPIAGILLSQGTIQKHLPGTNPSFPLWLNLILVALAGSIGCVIGSIAAYGIGYAGGRPLMLRYGRYVLISQHDADKADRFFQKWGSATAFFSRLLPVVRTYISLPAGITKMPFGKFCLYTFLGSLPWSLLLAYLGVILGNNLDRLKPIFNSLDVVIVALVVILVVLYVWRHIRNDRQARAEHVAAEAAALQPPFAQPWQQQPQQPQQPSQFQQPQWGQPQQPQQGWGQQQPPSQYPPQNQPPQAGDDRTLYRR